VFAERLVAGDSDRSAGMSSGDASGVEGADEKGSSDIVWSWSVACICCEDLR